MNPVLIAHVAATLYMVGLIWFVQIVHYPLLDQVGAERFTGYARRHAVLTGRVVGPPMVLELISAMWLLTEPQMRGLGLLWAGLGLLVAIWLSTALVQVPCHRILSQGFDAGAYRRLVRTNWIRTVAWSLRGGLVIWVLLLNV